MDKPYIVYVKSNPEGYITAVSSSAFLPSADGWDAIDSGYGDRYHHAQGNYFPEPILTSRGAFRYRLCGGIPAECTQQDIADQEAAQETVCQINQEERITQLETQNEMLIQCILELSEIVFA